jgi:hypothetical protein
VPDGSAPTFAFGDGTFRVPGQIAPGTYRTVRPATECYWTRLSGFTGGLGDLIASRISAGFEVATIEETDAGFDSVGCGEWTAGLRAVTQSRSQFGEGTYIVGTDIEPGTYTAAAVGSGGCEWARLAGFGGTDEEVVESNVVLREALARVTILPSDAGFTSGGCSTWSRSP